MTETDNALTVPGILASLATATPDRVAVRRKWRGIWQESTYGEVQAHVMHLALAWHDSGLRSGDRALIFGNNCPEWLYADLALQSIGCVPVPLHLTISAQDLRVIFAECAPKAAVCVTHKDLQRLQSALAPSHCPSMLIVLRPSLLGGIDRGILTFEESEDRGSRLAEESPLLYGSLLEAQSGDGWARIHYTAGADHSPRGAIVVRRSLAALAAQMARSVGIRPGDRVLAHVPLAHPAAVLMDIYTPLLAGGIIHFAESTESIDADRKEVRPTLMLSTPVVLNRLVHEFGELRRRTGPARRRLLDVGYSFMRRYEGAGLFNTAMRLVASWTSVRWARRAAGLGNLRHLWCIESQLCSTTANALVSLGIRPLIMYGLAETAGVAFMQVPGDSSRTLVPVAETRFRSDQGELIVANAVFGGYLGDTQRELAGEIRTGDVAHLDASGRLQWVGRRESLSAQVVGEAPEAAMLESELEALSVVDRAIVIRGVTGLTALIVLSAGFAGASGSSNGEAAGAVAPAEVRELLAKWEQSRELRLKLRMLSRPLSIEARHLTPTGRPRRRYLAAMHANPAPLRDVDELACPEPACPEQKLSES